MTEPVEKVFFLGSSLFAQHWQEGRQDKKRYPGIHTQDGYQSIAFSCSSLTVYFTRYLTERAALAHKVLQRLVGMALPIQDASVLWEHVTCGCPLYHRPHGREVCALCFPDPD
jgi:hypothetical protein